MFNINVIIKFSLINSAYQINDATFQPDKIEENVNK